MGWSTSNYGMDLDKEKRMGKIARERKKKNRKSKSKRKIQT